MGTFKKTNSFNKWKLQILLSGLSIIISSVTISTFAQVVMPPSTISCTSKDLEVTGAYLQVTGCLTQSQTIPLRLGIINKTGSTRTSFAMWGTLIRIDANDNEQVIRDVFACASEITPSGTEVRYLTTETITIDPNYSYRIDNVIMAWTTSNAKETCEVLRNNPDKINPKCGRVESLVIQAGVDAVATPTQPTCTTPGSISIYPYGGRAPYTISLQGHQPRQVQTAFTSEVYNGLSEGTYNFTITDAGGCTDTETATLSLSGSVATPAATVTQPNCSNSTGTVTVTSASYDALATYTLTKTGTTYTAANGVFNSVVAGTYTLTATKGDCSSNLNNVVVNSAPDVPGRPAATVTQPDCSNSTGTVTVTSASYNNLATYTITKTGTTFTAINGVFSLVTAGTYTLTATIGNCSTNGDNVVVNAQPTVPGTPAATVTQPTCSNATGTVTITPVSYNNSYTYTLTKNGTILTAVNGVFSSVAAGTYSLTATIGDCSSISPDNIVVNQQPSTPGAPSITVIQPSLCNNEGGSITICNPITGYTYYIVGGNYTITASGGTVSFTGLAAGSNPSIRVRTPDGCVSSATSCGNAVSNCLTNQTARGSDVQENNVITKQINIPADMKLGVKAFPNPYNDVIRFVINSEESGVGRLELFNMLGQKVKTVYQGRIAEGVQNFEISVPAQHRSTLIYVMTLNGKQFTGKLLNSSK